MKTYIRLWVVLVLLFFTTEGFAETATIRIRFANGRSGKPLAVKYMKVGGGGYDINGYRVEKVEKYALVVTFKDKTNFAFTDEGYYRCDTNAQTAPPRQYSIQEIVDRGIVAPNLCGKSNDPPVKGELLIYSRHAHFWEAVGNLRGLFVCG
jgi:hypothetical protein